MKATEESLKIETKRPRASGYAKEEIMKIEQARDIAESVFEQSFDNVSLDGQYIVGNDVRTGLTITLNIDDYAQKYRSMTKVEYIKEVRRLIDAEVQSSIKEMNDNLMRAIEHKGLSGYSINQKAGISQMTISNIRTHKQAAKSLTFAQSEALADLLGLSIDQYQTLLTDYDLVFKR